MSPWIEDSPLIHPMYHLHEEMTGYMSRSCRTRYAQANFGFVEVMNDSSSEDTAEVISKLKKRNPKRAGKKARKSTDSQNSHSQTQHTTMSKPPVLPSAPVKPVVPATLSRRLKGRHHPGGWHGRTILESNAAKMLLSKVNGNPGNVPAFVVEEVAGANQRTLQRIAENDKESVNRILKTVTKERNAATTSRKLKLSSTKIIEEIEGNRKPTGMTGQLRLELETQSDRVSGDMNRVLQMMNRKMVAAESQLCLTNGITGQVERDGDTADAMEVDEAM